MKRRFVLDAWAVLALLQGEEPAASRIKQLLNDAQGENIDLSISIINLGEVLYRIGKVKGQEEAWHTLDQMRRLPLTVIPADQAAVWAAVEFKMHHAISYADAFAAATTDALDAILVTGDRELEQLTDRIQIEMLERMGR
jgi:predicted nucleic acid-binding protein